jgi:hypothetical protein
MRLIEILSHILSIFGVYSLVRHVPFLLPRNLIPYVASVLTEVRELVDRAEANGAITDASKYRADLTRYEGIFAMTVTLTGRRTVLRINSNGCGQKANVLLGYFNNSYSPFGTV